MGEDAENPSPSSLVLFQTEDQKTRIEVRLEEGTVWLTQAQMAELFQTTPQNVTLHIKAIYQEGEQAEAATCKDYLQVRREGTREVTRKLRHYNLEVILAVGYRVRSHRGTQFRQWATSRLKEYLVKGFVMDDERLKNPGPGRPDYFDELLERIRDIRSSEKRVYLKLRDIFKLAADYEPTHEETQVFFQTIQNKLHWAVTGQTAAELIEQRADHQKPNMGLTAWSGTKVRKQDVTVAKNYLGQDEIGELNRIVVMYLDYAEDQAKRRKLLYMRDWKEKLDAFLRFNDRKVLGNAGAVAKAVADRHALGEYEKFQARRLAEGGQADEAAFDAEVAGLKKLPPAGPDGPSKKK